MISEDQPRRVTIVDLEHEMPLRTGDQTAAGHKYRRPEARVLEETQTAVEHVLWEPAEPSRP